MKLCVVTALFNHTQAPQIISNYQTFAKWLHCDLFVAELLLDGAEPIAPGALHLRASSRDGNFWQKENLLNLLIKSLPAKYDAVAWIDADILLPDNWVPLTTHALQYCPVVQLFEKVQRLDNESRVAETLKSAGVHINKGHPGYAWAARRDFLDKIGGLFAYDIFGGADSRMRWAFARRHPPKANQIFSQGLWQRWEEWTGLVQRQLRRPFMFVPQTVRHLPHGSPDHRQYSNRMRAAAKFQFDPATDICQDDQGLFRTTGRNPEMEDWLSKWLLSYHAELA